MVLYIRRHGYQGIGPIKGKNTLPHLLDESLWTPPSKDTPSGSIRHHAFQSLDGEVRSWIEGVGWFWRLQLRLATLHSNVGLHD